jgi:hypothetical protein
MPYPRARDPDSGFQERLKEIDRFFAGCSQVHKAMRRLVLRLERFEMPYAIVGGMAVNAHGHRQTTDDVDVLLKEEDFVRFEKLFLKTKYDLASGRRWRLIDRINGIPVDIVLTGTAPGYFRPVPIVYPDPTAEADLIDHVSYLNLRRLIEVKLAMRRYRDLGDVAALIRVHDLTGAFVEQLHPTLHGDYLLCLEEKRREEAFEAQS